MDFLFKVKKNMSAVIDATAPVSVTIAPQGYAVLESMTSVPLGPVEPGTSVQVRAWVHNAGATDTIYAKIFANGTQIPPGPEGETYYQPWGTSHVFWTTHVITENTTFSCECGHLEGTTYVMDHPHTSPPFHVVELLTPPAYPKAVIRNVEYIPGQQVEPGTEVTINYLVGNDEEAGMLWGGLYDYQSPNPNLIGGYWERHYNAGEDQLQSVSLVINEDLNAQLMVGHFEEG